MAEDVGGYFTLLEAGSRSGTFGVVRKAVDRRDGSFVAVKFVTGRSDELSQKVFERETRTLKELNHPNIIPYRASGIDETGTFYIVLSWVEQNLEDVLEGAGPWRSWDTLADQIAFPLIQALAYTHLKQVEHRDIKPKNVLVSSSGVPMLADFGIAKIRGDDEDTGNTNTVADWHSRPYAPPEINAEMRYVRDVYSIGVLLIQCLTEERLNTTDDVEAALQSIPLPPEIRRILETCLATDPADRPKNASDLLTALTNAQQRRRAVAAEATPKPIWLRLSRAATSAIAGAERVLEAQAVSHADLSGDVHATYFVDRESGQLQLTDVFLAGETWRFHVKPDLDGAVVVAARKLELEELERVRRRALLLPRRYSWDFRRPANIHASPGSDRRLLGGAG